MKLLIFLLLTSACFAVPDFTDPNGAVCYQYRVYAGDWGVEFIIHTSPAVADAQGYETYNDVTIDRFTDHKEGLKHLARNWANPYTLRDFAVLARHWPKTAAPVPDPNEITYPTFPIVWITPTGSKFHTRECFYAVTAVPQPLSVALDRGLMPCSYCKSIESEEPK